MKLLPVSSMLVFKGRFTESVIGVYKLDAELIMRLM